MGNLTGEVMSVISKWHPAVRWICVIPTLFVVWFIANTVSRIAIFMGFGTVEPGSWTELLTYGFGRDFTAIFLATASSTLMAPRFRVVLSGIYIAIFVFLGGVNYMHYLNGTLPIETSKFVVSSIFNFGAVIACLLYSIKITNDERIELKKRMLAKIHENKKEVDPEKERQTREWLGL